MTIKRIKSPIYFTGKSEVTGINYHVKRGGVINVDIRDLGLFSAIKLPSSTFVANKVEPATESNAVLEADFLSAELVEQETILVEEIVAPPAELVPPTKPVVDESVVEEVANPEDKEIAYLDKLGLTERVVALLNENGLTTKKLILKFGDLTAIDGIGAKTAKAILEAVN